MPATSHTKQQLCPWCALRQAFLPTGEEGIVMCSNCGQAAVREGQFLRRCTAEDTIQLSTEEIQAILADGEAVRLNNLVRILPRQDLISIEPHLTVKDVATRWQMCAATVLHMFAGETGIIRFGPAHKRSLRIPISVVEKVHARLQQS